MAKWFVTTKRADFDKLAQKFHISPMLARIIRNRDVVEEEAISKYLHGTLDDLYSPALLKDMEIATKILQDKIKQHKTIRIIGDYDIDGICSTYILKKGLQHCGAVVDTVIPHRIKDGYGLNDNLIQEAKDSGVDTIVTCDNGIAAYEQIVGANMLGMTVIITDHHEVPFEETEGIRQPILPPAAAVVDPKREDCPYPYKNICGAVVAYKLVQSLVQKMGIPDYILNELSEFAAIATIGDVMDLQDENRILVKYGLQAVARTENIGLKALLSVNGLEGKVISPYHVGFILGPCLNATGRLDSAQRALELFETKETREAAAIAGDLKALNDSRKEMTAKGLEKAIEQIETTGLQEDKVLVVYIPECHESLAGIIAGRVREKYGKPTFILTMGEEGVKGSGRSIEAFHMYEEMSKHKELFSKFGGHKMAAGLSMTEDKIAAFRTAMNRGCSLTEEDFASKIQIDIPMPVAYATKELTEELSLLEPFGSANAKPLFAQKNINFISGKVLGINKNVGKYIIEDDNKQQYDVIYFGDIAKFNQYISEKYGTGKVQSLYEGNAVGICLSIVYYPEINEFRGNRSLQLVMKDYQ